MKQSSPDLSSTWLQKGNIEYEPFEMLFNLFKNAKKVIGKYNSSKTIND